MVSMAYLPLLLMLSALDAEQARHEAASAAFSRVHLKLKVQPLLISVGLGYSLQLILQRDQPTQLQGSLFQASLKQNKRQSEWVSMYTLRRHGWGFVDKQAGGTPQILVDKTSPMTGRQPPLGSTELGLMSIRY